MSIATSTSAKALQRPAADKIAYLFDGSMIMSYYNGTAGQVAQITSPLSSPSVTNLITTTEDGVSLYVDNSSGTSSDIWVVSSADDGSGTGPSIHIRHGSYNGSSFTWDTSTSIPGSTQAATIQSSVVWNGTYLIAFWWDGVSGSDRVAFNWTSDKTGQTGWIGCTRAPVLSSADTWSTVIQVIAKHSVALGATIVAHNGNSKMNYACLPDSSNSGPVTGATLTNTGTWSGTSSTAVSAGVLVAFKPASTTPVTQLGKPSQVLATAGSVTGSWASDQTRTSGDLLVAVVSATGTTSAAATASSSGWTKLLEAGATTKALISFWTKTASGSDSAPTFTSTISGTATMSCTLLVLKNAATSSFNDASNTVTNSGSISSQAITTSGNIATNGDFAICGLVRERSAGTTTYTPAVGWANVVNDGSTSTTGHASVDVRGGPDISRWGGRTSFDQFTDSFGFGGPSMVIDEANGKIHCATASPNAGGPTWTGIQYWLGSYASNAVTWGTRVAVDSTSTATGPPDIAVGIDKNGKVYVVWVTDLTSNTMKYSTLVSPYTSAVSGGTISTSGSQNRWPHIPAFNKSQTGLTDKLPILYTDTTSSAYPINLDTSITLPSSATTGTGSVTRHKMGLSGTGAYSTPLSGSVRMHKTGLTATAIERISGTGSVARHKMGLSSVAVERISGAGSVSWHKMGLSSSAVERISSTGSVTRHKMGLSGTVVEIIPGTGSVSRHKMGVLASGTERISASAVISRHKMGLSGTVIERISGTGSIQRRKISVSGSAVERITGTGSVSRHKMRLSGIAAERISCNGSSSLSKMGLSATGIERISGDGFTALRKMGLSGTVAERISGIGSIARHKMILTGSGSGITLVSGTGSVKMRKMGVSGSAIYSPPATGSVRMHKMGLSGSVLEVVPCTGFVTRHKMGVSGLCKERISGNASISRHKMGLRGTGAGTISISCSGSVQMNKMSVLTPPVRSHKPSSLFVFSPL